MPAKAATDGRRRSHLLAALAYRAKKVVNRDDLKAGNTRIIGHIDAKIGQADFLYEFDGELTVSPDGHTTVSSSPSPAHLIALLLSSMTEGRRAAWIEKHAQAWAADEFPVPDALVLRATETFLKRCRSSQKTIKRGSVIFTSAE